MLSIFGDAWLRCHHISNMITPQRGLKKLKKENIYRLIINNKINRLIINNKMSNTNYCEIYGKFLHCMINTTDPSKCVGDDVLKNMRRYPGNDYTYYTNVNNI